MSACGGRSANTVMVNQFGDANKGCDALQTELTFIEQEIQRLLPKTHKTGKNVALGVTGFFLVVPLFFMDLSHAEQEEINAFRKRYGHLSAIAADKKCEIHSTTEKSDKNEDKS